MDKLRKPGRVDLRAERLEERTTPVVGSFTDAAFAEPGQGFDGVVYLETPDEGACSGALLYSGRHVLTAAHCVDDDGDGVPDGDVVVRFDLPGGAVRMTVPAINIRIAPGWEGGAGEDDLAVLELPALAPSGPGGANRYDLYRSTDEVGRLFALVGYGRTGAGEDGSVPGTSGVRRWGMNRFDADELFRDGGFVVPRGQGLVADFDSGSPANDAFGFYYDRDDLGLGQAEAAIAPGDSGGPALLQVNGQYFIAGVATFILNGGDADVDFFPDENSSFGDFFGYTRMSVFAGRVDALVARPHDLVLDMSFQPAGGDGMADALRVTQEGDVLSVFVNGTLLHSESITGVARLRLVGSGDAERVEIDPSVSSFLLVETPGFERVDDRRMLLPPAALTPGTNVGPADAASVFAAGAGRGAPPLVGLYDPDGTARLEGMAFEAGFTGGARVAAGDVNGDGVPDLVVSPGPGSPPVVKVFDGRTGVEIENFVVFEQGFQGGVFVESADLNGDGFAEVLVSPDEGGGPRVRVFDGRSREVLADFFGIEDPAFRGGARLGLGDVNRDGATDLLVGAGFGGGPRVAVFDGADLLSGDPPRKLFPDFFVFENTLRNGVYLAGGDLDGDGFAEVIVGGGPGGGPRVFALSGAELVGSGGTRFEPVVNFFAGDVTSRGGVRVRAKELDGDNRTDLVTGSGDGEQPLVRVYAGSDLGGAASPSPLRELDPFPGAAPGGVFVG
ncbi:MAG TPA: trypsin-like serine protease [Gemmataceae bacterium]